MSYISRIYNRIAYIRFIYIYTFNRVNTCAHTIRLLSINRRLYFAHVYVLERQYVRSISMRQTRIAYISVRIISFVVIVIRRMLTIIITSTVTITINDNNSSNNLTHTQSVLGDDPKRTMHTIKFVINWNWTFICALQEKKIRDVLEKFYNVYALIESSVATPVQRIRFIPDFQFRPSGKVNDAI